MKTPVAARHLSSTFARLRPDASIEPLPVDESFWARLTSGRLGDFHHEYLVSLHEFDADWSSWERHPHGDEIVCLLDGDVTFVLDEGDGEQHVRLADGGAYLVVPRGAWHTARVAASSRMLFITAGEGTEHRPLEK